MPAQNAQDPIRVLVVDDTPEIRLLASYVLEDAGWQALTAADGTAGVALARQERPDLILMDVMMPGIDGYEACARIKQQAETADIPVIFMTAISDPQAETKAFTAGAADFIAKPLSPAALQARVRAQVALYRQRRSLEGMFHDALEFAPDAVILCDLTGRMVRVNARAEGMLGYRREELRDRGIDMLVTPRQRTAFVANLTAYAARSGLTREGVPAICVRKDGSEFPGEISVTVLQTANERILMAALRDVTRWREQQERLRAMAAQAEAAREQERKAIAREVHDELGQVLTALRMDLTWLEMQGLGAQPALAAKVQEMRGLVDRAIQGVRDVATTLRPAALDMGLAPALQWLADEFARSAGVACRCEVQELKPAPDEARSVAVFRIAQEALTNVARHAQATEATLTLGGQGEHLRLTVQDNGAGFDPQAMRAGTFGLLGMRERALAMGGRVEVTSRPGAGTRVELEVPAPNASSEAGA